MCLAKCVFLYFCLILVSAVELQRFRDPDVSHNKVSADYLDDGLRSECHLENCTKECRPWPATCARGYCECYPLLERVKPNQLASRFLTAHLRNRKSLPGSIYNNPDLPQNPATEDLAKPREGQEEKTALRHHIAHFCLNIPLAEACIRTCMKVGQPAFCGKDHVCYCGHKYTPHDKNDKIDVEAVHNQYRDLYEKYFGPEF